jgi:hypothetical protein
MNFLPSESSAHANDTGAVGPQVRHGSTARGGGAGGGSRPRRASSSATAARWPDDSFTVRSAQ